MTKKNCDKMHIIGGIVNESKDDLENIKDFIKRWEEKIKDIELRSLDNDQCYEISKMFLDEFGYRFLYVDSLDNKQILIDQLYHDFRIALIKANNRYKRENRSFWNLFFKDKLKLPELHFHTR